MNQTPSAPGSILAVIAIYQTTLAQSQSYRSLVQILDAHPSLASYVSLLVYDNSPVPQALSASVTFPFEYTHDPGNGGLAAAYNHALNRAAAQSRTWLLLLDQDTSLTLAFVEELVKVAINLHAESSVAALAPKLVVGGVIHSPALPFVVQMRRQFGRRPAPIDRACVGIQPQLLFPYNSAAALRVSAVQAVGGFPAAYWLDFLDHAMFAALFSAGYQLYLLLAALEHESSYADPCSLPLWRFRNVLASQALFMKQYAGFTDRVLYRVWLLRHSRSLRSCQGKGLWRFAVRQAFLLNTEAARRTAAT